MVQKVTCLEAQRNLHEEELDSAPCRKYVVLLLETDASTVAKRKPVVRESLEGHLSQSADQPQLNLLFQPVCNTVNGALLTFPFQFSVTSGSKDFMFSGRSSASLHPWWSQLATALQANARTVHTFSRDGGLPDWGIFCKMASNHVPINAVWVICLVSGAPHLRAAPPTTLQLIPHATVILGLLRFASDLAVKAIFSLCAIALDSSYAVPIACKLLVRNHPEVNFHPVPFALPGILSTIIPIIAVCWVSFTVIVLAMPETLPINQFTWNYSSTILGGVLVLSWIWYALSGRKHYLGPREYVHPLECTHHASADFLLSDCANLFTQCPSRRPSQRRMKPAIPSHRQDLAVELV